MTESKMENVIRLRSKEFRRDKGVKWSRINKYLPFKWIPIGYEVNNNSCAYDIFHSFIQNSSFNQTIAAKQTSIANEPNEVLAASWFWNVKIEGSIRQLTEEGSPASPDFPGCHA